ncbi:MAG: hypothetical protein LLF94_09575 [Chlamydiales bacterium]|nr:hypothetical protein [Chlamydiales bacterium]
MAVTIVSCYFLPFLFFFFAQIAFPKSILACVLGIAALSVSCIILYVLMLDQKKLPENFVPEVYPPLKSEQPIAPPQAVIVAESKPKISYQQKSPILASAKTALTARPQVQIANHKAIIEEQKRALLSQQNLFTEELEKKTATLNELQASLEHALNALKAKDIETAKQAKELEDLKFELYTLLRIESYVTPKENLAAASF